MVFLLCYVWPHANAQQQLNTYQGEFIYLSSHADYMSTPVYWLKTAESRTYSLLFDESPDPGIIKTGDYGHVIGTMIVNNDLYRNTINVSSYLVTALSETAYVNGGAGGSNKGGASTTYDMKSITFVMGICNKSSISKPFVEQNWTRLESYIRACTYDKFTFNQSSNIIVGPINLPCTNSKYLYDFKYCSNSEIYGWASHAEDYARTVLKIPVDKYRHRLFMLPEGINCKWAGLGMMGCGSVCYSWYNGKYGLKHDVILHELGHNFGLSHSASPTNEYGDGSCAMGGCCNIRCFNSPQAWVLGLTEPIATFSSENLKPGVKYSFALPAHLKTTRNFIKINADWINATLSYHISFRDNTSFDSSLLPTYMSKVLVHRFWKPRAFGMLPIIQGIMSKGYTYNIPFIDTIVRFVDIKQFQAIIEVCRKSSPASEVCGDGLDNNCDGRIDEGCTTTPNAPAPKPPKPPLPPLPPPPTPTFTMTIRVSRMKDTSVSMSQVRTVLCPALAALLPRSSAATCTISTSITILSYTLTYAANRPFQIVNVTDFTLKAKIPCDSVILPSTTSQPIKAVCVLPLLPPSPPPPQCRWICS